MIDSGELTTGAAPTTAVDVERLMGALAVVKWLVGVGIACALSLGSYVVTQVWANSAAIEHIESDHAEHEAQPIHAQSAERMSRLELSIEQSRTSLDDMREEMREMRSTLTQIHATRTRRR